MKNLILLISVFFSLSAFGADKSDKSIPLPKYSKTGGGEGQTDFVAGLYLEYAATDKLTLNMRYENVDAGPYQRTYVLGSGAADGASDGEDITVTANYKIWDGVMTRFEYRHTNVDDLTAFPDVDEHSHSLFVNVIYEF